MHEKGGQRFRAVMPPALESVSRVRREVCDLATGWKLPPDVVADAALVVSELATNAVLHARTDFVVDACRIGQLGVRFEVTDASGDPVLFPVSPPDSMSAVPEDLDELDALREVLSDAGTTGRGLSLVAKVADIWGVTAGPRGKTVWAELGAASMAGDGAAPPPVAAPPRVPLTGRRVVMRALPVRLIVESDRHFDDLLRELQVMALAGEEGELGALADEAIRHLGGLRHTGRSATRAALARGDRQIDLELLIPQTANRGFRELATLLERVSAESRAGRLLTGPPGEEVRAFRRWYQREVEAQLRGDPPQPCPFPTVPPRLVP
ncbi:MAG: ATP-binding protein [Acidimicrobiaceae bacterium]|nr:ATP-binding protein [Acidimicrobiaceae bacterium]